MGTRLLRRKNPGQSIILIAFVLAVLIGLAGLSLDVGEAYAEQRAAQRAVNSAAIKGVDSLIRGRADVQIYNDIAQTLRANGINLVDKDQEAGPGQTRMRAIYLDGKGNQLGDVGARGNQYPGSNVTYIRVELDGTTETSLARLFGTETLPVVVNTYGGRGPCTNGIYPFAVQDKSFTGQPANPSKAGLYSDGFYKEMPWRRIYGKDTAVSGGFGWLSWKVGSTGANAGSNIQMRADLTGEGTIHLGFVEAPWQPGTPAGNVPEGYPILPGYLNAHDWVYGSTGGNFNGVDDELDWHVTNRTEMLLPMYDVASGSGANAAYHVTGIGRFLLKEWGKEGGKSYLDLVFLGETGGCPTLVNPPQPSDNADTPTLTGKVLVKPRYINNNAESGPVDIILVIDESVSMAWNWQGGTQTSSSNPSRLKVTKDAAKQFIGSFLGPEDRMAIISFGQNGGNTGQVMPYPDTKTFTQGQIDNAVNKITALDRDWTSGTSQGKAQLQSAIDGLQADGNTPTYPGLERARRVMSGARSTAVVNGQSVKVSKVLVLLTDGVANIYPDGKFNKCPDGKNRSENCVAHLASKGQPIWWTGKVAEQMKTTWPDLTIYTIAMGYQFDVTGLNLVSSQPTPPYFNRADNLTQMQPIFDSIKRQIDSTACVPAEESLQSPVDVGRLQDSQVIGEIRLIDTTTKALTAKGTVFEENGEAWYRFENLKPGTYEIEGYVKYRDKNSNRVRTYSFVSNGSASYGPTLAYTFNPEGNLGTLVYGPSLHFDLPTGICTPN
jgi:hypothetical protein